MIDPKDYLDCCQTPKLANVLTIVDTTHESEILRRCEECRKWWFYRFFEFVSFDGPDDITEWYTSLTDEEAIIIKQAKERPNLSFLGEKGSFMIDNQGVRKIKGQPTYLWYGS